MNLRECVKQNAKCFYSLVPCVRSAGKHEVQYAPGPADGGARSVLRSPFHCRENAGQINFYTCRLHVCRFVIKGVGCFKTS